MGRKKTSEIPQKAKSEVEALTAPPSFKRKGTASKSKSKGKQE